jgi:hydroxymethylpyrimidine/phosphomethylpyrimidine kinase
MLGLMTQPIPLLTIAGSDSGGAAGLQADLKTWAALGVYGLSAITAVTAQNSVRVQQLHYLPPAMIAAQIDAVLSDYGAAAIKTGFLGRVEIIEVVAKRLRDWMGGGLPARPTLVIDPVLVNHRGEAMFAPEVAGAYREWLFPLADLVTPNRAEAALLGLIDDGHRLVPTTLLESDVSGSMRILLKGVPR